MWGSTAAQRNHLAREGAHRRDHGARDMRSAVLSSIVGAEALLLDAIMQGALLTDDSVAARAFAAELTELLLDNGSVLVVALGGGS